jgi:thioredoxin reductase (NADPH)
VGRGISTCATGDGFFFHNKKIIVVGGGNSAMEGQMELENIPLEVLAGERGVTGIKFLNNITSEEEIIETEGIFVTIGHTTNTKFLDGQLDTVDIGYLKVKPGPSETNILRVCLPVAMCKTRCIVKQLLQLEVAVWQP